MRLSRLLLVAMLALIAAQIWARRGASGVGNVTQAPHTLKSSLAGGRSTTAFPALSPQVATSKQIAAFGNLPMSFEENTGQTDGQVRFISHGPGYVLFLSSGESVFKFSGQTTKPRTRANNVSAGRNRTTNKGAKPSAVLRMKMEGAKGTPTILGVDKLPGVSNYLIGKDQGKWRKGVASYSKIQYSEIYPGIDLVYYGNQHQLEYDFVVKPGADPKQVSLAFDGAQNLTLDSASGDVSLQTAAGSMALRKPVIYQMENGQKKLVDGNYKVQGNGRLAFDVKNYNRAEPLVIDPILVYSTYLGGSSDDGGYLLAVDPQGRAYLTGYTDSTDFPIAGTSISPAPSGNFEAFVAKLSPDGTSLVYSTYLGGSGGDFASDVALDSNGNAYVVGNTSSTDFPVTANAFQSSLATGATSNVFLSKLSADGQSLLYSTYLGGGGIDYGFGIAVDANQNAYLTGETTSGSPTPFPTTSNAFQSTLNSPYGNGFITRIDTTATGAASLIYSTFLGGTTQGYWYWDQGTSIAVDANNNVYVVGMACSLNFPITSATAYKTTGNINGSAYLTQIDTTKSGSSGLIYSTFFGGTGSTDQAASVALDSTGKVYLTGGTGSSDFPVTTNVTNSGPGKGFVAKFDTTRSQSASLLYSTLVGGSSGEFSGAIAVDPIGNAYISGWTFSSDFPVTADAIQSTKGTGVNNSFLAVLSWDASKILYGTYLGGNGSSNLTEFAYGLALDPSNNIYVAGGTGSADFQTTSGAFQTSLNGSSDAFIAKLSALPIPMISSLSQLSGPNGAQITINGLNFGSSQGSSAVTFGTDTAPIVTWGDTAIVAQVPAFAPLGLLQVTVTTSLESSHSEPFIVTTSSPYIDSLSPVSGAPGTLVTITGSQFGGTQGQGVVFNGIAAPINAWSDTSITVHVPAGASTGNVTVSNGSNLTSNGVNFTVPLIMTGLNTNSGPVGAPVTITGTGFGAAQGSSTVSFNGTMATVSSWGASSITATVPSGATTGNLMVTVSGANSNALTFTVLPTPTITSLSVTSGTVTTPVTITGTGFGATQGSSGVAFNGVTSAISSWSATSISTSVPIGATSGNVVVTLGGVVSNGVNFTVSAPPLVSLAVTPANPILFVTGTQQFTAIGTYLDATMQDLTSVSTWSSSNTAAATISSTGLASAVALGQTTIQATVGSVAGTTNLTVGTFATNASMNSPHSGHTATLLTDGRMLIADGPIEIYSPSTHTFIDTGNLNTPRTSTTATLLNDGTTLFVGGYDVDGNTLASAEIFSPATGTFAFAGSMSTARASHAATLLNDGTVLIAGGFDGNYNVLASAEIYNPATGTFTGAGVMYTARAYHTATLLNDGTVLIAGGSDNTGTSLATAEIFNPASQSFTAVASMNSARQYHTATLLNDGTVLIAGGLDNGFNPLSSAEIYNPGSATFTSTGTMSNVRLHHTATLLNNGTVLVTGGTDNFGSVFSSVDVYDPATSSFTAIGNMNVTRFSQTATLLDDGSVLVAGGTAGGDFFIPVASTELYLPSSLTPPNLVSIAVSPSAPSISAGEFQPFTAIGTFSDNSTQVLSSVTWNSSDNTKVTLTNDATNRGHAFALAAGSVTVSVCAGPVCGSAAVSVSSGQLLITGLYPPSGNVGSSVVIAGTGFGATQGTSTVTFNGTAASVTSWSATGIIVTVPSGATTGPVVVAVSGSNSNGVTFSVSSGPVVASLSASFGSAGTPVTISGSNFGGSQGTSQVAFNGSLAAVTSWTDSSIIATVPANSSTGNIIVTVSGVASNGVRFTVPAIGNVTPQSGPLGTLVDIAGSGFGATQGSGVASINGTAMNVVSWSDSEILAAVTSGTTTGTLMVQQGTISLTGPQFTINPSFPYTVSPQGLNMLVGETRTVSVTNNGSPVKGLRWVTTNPAIVSLSMDDPPVLKGVAAGAATVYAGVVPLYVTVYAGSSLSSGTAIWSLPLGSSSELDLVPAVPSSSGADVFALDNTGTLSAISSDGNLVWNSTVGVIEGYSNGNSSFSFPVTSIIPDFSGNAVVKNTYTYVVGNTFHSTHIVQKLDSTTQVRTTLYTFSDQVTNCCNSLFNDNASVQVIIPDTTGALFVQDNATVNLFKLSTGSQIGSSLTMDSSTENGGVVGPPHVGHMIVAGDGNAYVPYVYNEATVTLGGGGTVTIDTLEHLMVLRVSPDGSSTKIGLKNLDWLNVETSQASTYSGQSYFFNSFPLSGGNPTDLGVITNAGNGATVFAPECTFLSGNACSSQVSMSFVSNDSVLSQTIVQLGGFLPGLQREDGSYVGLDSDDKLDAVGTDGSVLWRKTFTNDPYYGGVPAVTPLYATADGGVIATTTIPACEPGNIGFSPLFGYPVCQLSTDEPIPLPYSPRGQLGTLYTLDKDGTVTSQTADTGAKLSWTGQWYEDPAGTLSEVALLPPVLAPSFWPYAGANPSENSVALLRETLYLRSFAPWPWFGPDPIHFCISDCFKGDNRSFSTSTESSVTSRVNGIVDFGLPGMIVISKRAYSDLSFDIAGRKGKAQPTITASSNGNGGLHVEIAGSNPLVFGAPDIDTKLNVNGQFGGAQSCYSGHLYGDAFPNSEAFLVNSQKEAEALITFGTTEDRNLGPFTLYGNRNKDMGVFAGVCLGN